MSPKFLPRYPVYVPSKGRPESLTAAMFTKDGVPFRLVVEPQDAPAYVRRWGADRILTLPQDNRGLVYARNWIKDHATTSGAARHWQFDDDVKYMCRLHRGRRLYCESGVALAFAEDFADRHENVGLVSFNSTFFVRSTAGGTTVQQWPPFYLNARCYTCFLILDALPNRWRGRYNEDTDMTLQVLADKWCTILFNVFLIWCPTTMAQGGGQTEIYKHKRKRLHPADVHKLHEEGKVSPVEPATSRLAMARELERRWPGVVTTRRRFGRAQHHVADHWRKFDTPLRVRPGAPPLPDYGLTLVEKAPVQAEGLKALLEEYGE